MPPYRSIICGNEQTFDEIYLITQERQKRVRLSFSFGLICVVSLGTDHGTRGLYHLYSFECGKEEVVYAGKYWTV